MPKILWNHHLVALSLHRPSAPQPGPGRHSSAESTGWIFQGLTATTSYGLLQPKWHYSKSPKKWCRKRPGPELNWWYCLWTTIFHAKNDQELQSFCALVIVWLWELPPKSCFNGSPEKKRWLLLRCKAREPKMKLTSFKDIILCGSPNLRQYHGTMMRKNKEQITSV